MDTGSGDIRCLKDFVDVKGKLVEWSVGEEVEIKGCRFRVDKIKNYPENQIVLTGIPNKPFEELPPEHDDVRTPSQAMKDFIRSKNRRRK